MFDVHVRPALAARSGGRTVERRILRIAGMPESRVDELAAPIYLPWLTAPVPIETTILASPGIVELQLSARGSDRAGMTAALDAAAAALANAVGDSVFTQTGAALEVVVGEALRARGATVALAESCTGGLASARLTDVPGSSAYVRGGVVAYSNDVKIEPLGVDAALIAAHGAVSEPVAAAMAAGVRRVLAADIGVGVTGIAGPDGGTPDKPVGTVWFAVDGPGHRRTTHVRVLPGDRHVIRQWAVVVLLDLVRRALRDSQ
jgi:nicotinamide-nucleotide amidase